MKMITSLLLPSLFMVIPFAWAEADEPLDLRYCLALQGNNEIAKCAGETAAGPKGKPYSKDEVDKILSGMQAAMSESENDLPAEINEDGSPE